MQQDTDACAQLKSDATANSCQMPAGFAAEWAKTFAMHEASMKAVADKLQAVLMGTIDSNPCSFMAENNKTVLSYKADSKTFRRLVAEYIKRATTAASTQKMAKEIEAASTQQVARAREIE